MALQFGAERVGRVLQADGKIEKAKQYYEAVIESYPKTKAAEEARTLLENLNK